jgi:putative ABC transport system substrate-binding protein
MRRRVFLCGSAMIVAAPQAAKAQPGNKLPRVGYVQSEAAALAPLHDAFLQGLRERGWIDGRNMVFDWRKRDEEIADLVRLNSDVMVLPNPYRLQAGLKLTKTIPIVTVDLESDPVEKEFLKSLSRPGGNLTGIWMDIPEIAGKQLQLLKEAVPGVRRVGVVWDDRVAGLQFAATEVSARVADIVVHRAPLRNEHEVDDVFKRAMEARSQAILILTSPVVLRVQRRLAELAVQHRLATVSGFSTFPDDGGLMAFGPNFPAMFRQMAGYVDRILRGAKAGDLPVERPAKFELVINLKTAKALGLTIPPSLLARADQVIE